MGGKERIRSSAGRSPAHAYCLGMEELRLPATETTMPAGPKFSPPSLLKKARWGRMGLLRRGTILTGKTTISIASASEKERAKFSSDAPSSQATVPKSRWFQLMGGVDLVEKNHPGRGRFGGWKKEASHQHLTAHLGGPRANKLVPKKKRVYVRPRGSN